MADEKRDWVGEAVKCFITDVPGICPTDPVAAIRLHFEQTASDDLKAACAAQGKTAEGCWKFLEACARKALHGRSGHVDPSTVFAIAMHWFQDVPVDWAGSQAAEKRAEPKQAPAPEEVKKPVAETPKQVMPKAPKAERRRKPKPSRQEFFFELMETQEGGADAQSVQS